MKRIIVCLLLLCAVTVLASDKKAKKDSVAVYSITALEAKRDFYSQKLQECIRNREGGKSYVEIQEKNILIFSAALDAVKEVLADSTLKAGKK